MAAAHDDTKAGDGRGLTVKTDPRQIQFKQILEGDKFQRALTATLPRTIRPDRMIRVVLAAMQQSPKLLECSPESVLLSIMRSAAMGLEPDGGVLGHGYLVPFWNGKAKRLECQFIPGYRGLVKLARNSGEVADVWAEVVYDADEFRYELGLDQTLTHRRNDAVADPGAMRYAYAVARFRDGERKFVVMNRREMEAIKKRSASKDKDGNLVGPWVTHEPEMWKKSAVRRLAKLLPLSVEAASAVAYEPDEHESASVVSAAIPEVELLSLDVPEPQADQSTESAPEPEQQSPSEESTADSPVVSGPSVWFDDCEDLSGVGKRERELLEAAGSDEQGTEILKAAEAARNRVRSTRGPRVNTNKHKE